MGYENLPMEKLEKILVVGNMLRIDFGKGNSNNATIEIRSIIDDDHVVYKTLSKYKHTWDYKLNHKIYFAFLLRDGYMRKLRNAKKKKTPAVKIH